MDRTIQGCFGSVKQHQYTSLVPELAALNKCTQCEYEIKSRLINNFLFNIPDITTKNFIFIIMVADQTGRFFSLVEVIVLPVSLSFLHSYILSLKNVWVKK